MSSRRVVLLLICPFLLLFYNSEPKSFVFKDSPEEESKWSKFKGKVLPKVIQAGKYFTARPPLDVNVSDNGQSVLNVVPEEVNFDPCSTSDQICLNGGKCMNDKGKFYCNCESTHYGKRCEVVADKSACGSKHDCLNNAVCYSTPNSQKVVVREKLEKLHWQTDLDNYNKCRNDNTKSADECERSKEFGSDTSKEIPPPTKKDFDDLAKTVKYRCQCPLGFQGPLCDYTREERMCDEDYCMGHGYAMIKEGKCTCACEPEYTGEHCETLLPCSAFPCHNEGICKDEYNPTTGEYTAKCICPDMSGAVGTGTNKENVHLAGIPMRITGEHCEMLELLQLDKAKDLKLNEIDPCGNVPEYLDKVKSLAEEDWFHKTYVSAYQKKMATTETEIRKFNEEVQDLLCGDDQTCLKRKKNICDNLDNVCSVVAGPVGPAKVLFPVPRCSCPTLRYKRNCDGVRKTLCDVTDLEREAGITEASRCTSFKNGKCSVNPNGERYCECASNSGWTGEKCEIYAPCEATTNPCPNGECIAIPVELSKPGEQSYRCVCDIADEQKGNECVYSGVGKCAGVKDSKGRTINPCNHGKCVVCPDTSGNESSICNEDEQTRGFRCICAPGYGPPLCLNPEGPCEAHLCLNEGICKVNKDHSYDCSCPPGTSGDYCETIDDYCEFIGDRKCGNTGTCSNSNETIRGFLCSCKWEYRGADCEEFAGKLAGFYLIFDENYMISYPLTALFFCIIFLVIADFLCGRDAKVGRKKREEKRDETSVSSTNKPSNKTDNPSESQVAGAPNTVPMSPSTTEPVPRKDPPAVVVPSTPVTTHSV